MNIRSQTADFVIALSDFDFVNRLRLRDPSWGPCVGPQPSKPPMTARIERPLSPHLQTYRVTLTMAMSIIHRITGVALYFGTLFWCGG